MGAGGQRRESGLGWVFPPPLAVWPWAGHLASLGLRPHARKGADKTSHNLNAAESVWQALVGASRHSPGRNSAPARCTLESRAWPGRVTDRGHTWCGGEPPRWPAWGWEPRHKKCWVLSGCLAPHLLPRVAQEVSLTVTLPSGRQVCKRTSPSVGQSEADTVPPQEVRVCPSVQGESRARQHPQPAAADSPQLGVGTRSPVSRSGAGAGCVCAR